MQSKNLHSVSNFTEKKLNNISLDSTNLLGITIIILITVR